MAEPEDPADALYDVLPADFLPARQAAVAAARAAGDTTSAARLAAMRKPTTAAWLCNQLVRAHPDEVTAAIGLGAQLRDATVAGDRDTIRELTGQRRRLVTDLVNLARAEAQEHGQVFTAQTQRDLEATVTAAAADPASAVLVLTGRLASPLTFEGLGFEQGALPPPTPAHVAAQRAAAAATTHPGKPSRKAGPTETGPTEAGRTEAGESKAGASRVAPAVPVAPSPKVEEAELALTAARLQHADAEAELEALTRALASAQQSEQDAAAAHEQALAALAGVRADVKDAKKDVAATSRAVASALSRVERLTRPSGR